MERTETRIERRQDGAARILAWRPSGAEYDPAIDRILAGLRPRLLAAAREKADAPALLSDLLRHAPGRREVLVRNSRRFENLALSGLLLETSARECADTPDRSEPLAGLALHLIGALDPARYGDRVLADARARCWLQIADARRRVDDLRGAAGAVRTAQDLLRRGTGDRLARARLLACRAGLRMAEHRCDEAADLFRRAISLFLSIGEPDRAADAMVELARLEEHRRARERRSAPCPDHLKVKAFRPAAAAIVRS
jgi:hypothetical protein